MSREGSIKRDPERGTWTVVVDVSPPGGRRRQVRRRGFRTKDAAREERDRIVQSVREGTWTEKDRRLLGDYLEGWLERLPVEGLSASTMSQYRNVVKLWVKPHKVATIPVQSLAPEDLEELYATLLEAGRSARTVRLVHGVLGKALDKAVPRLIPANPVRQATAPSAKAARRKELTVWSPEELRAVLAAVDRTDAIHVAISLMATTGLRRSEALGLWWEDLDLEAGRATITRGVVAVDGQAVYQPTTKTEGGRRTVDLGPATVKVLKAWRAEQNRQRLRVGPGWKPEGSFVFTDETGAMIHPHKVASRVRTLARRAKVPAIRVHDLRHTHATHLLASGVNLKVVAERLGHADEAFTLRTYAHLLPGQQAEAASAVEALVLG